MLPKTLLIAFCCLAAACGDDTSGGDAGADLLTFDSGVELPFRVSVRSVPLRDGASVPWERGNQGGTMLVLDIAFDGELLGDRDEIGIRLEHSPVPGAEDAYRVESEFESQSFNLRVREQDGEVSLSIFDQHGVAPLDESQLRLRIEVVSTQGSGVLEVDLMVTSEYVPPPPSECEGFDIDEPGGGCRYVHFPGTVTPELGEIADGSVSVRWVFTATRREAAQVCSDRVETFAALEDGQTGTLQTMRECCVEALGLSEGPEFPATASIIVDGTCSPSSLDFSAPCDC